MREIPGLTGGRRLNPKPWDYCAYVLRRERDTLQEVVAAEFAPEHDSVVVDLGCGERPYEPLFTQRACRYIGADIVGNTLADVTFEPGEPVPLADETADLVLSTEVLAHVVDVSAYLHECLRLLKRGGLLVLTTHGFWTYCPYPTDVRRWTCWGLKHELEQHGFQVESLHGCMGPLAYTTQLRLQLVRGLLLRFGFLGRTMTNALSYLAQGVMSLEDRITPSEVSQQNSAVYVVTGRKPN